MVIEDEEKTRFVLRAVLTSIGATSFFGYKPVVASKTMDANPGKNPTCWTSGRLLSSLMAQLELGAELPLLDPPGP